MPKPAKNLNELFKQLEEKISKVLIEDVAPVVKEKEQKLIDREVYSKYDPTMYKRKYDEGGLKDKDNMEATLLNHHTLSVENIRKDDETGRLVAPIVEYGKGYQYEFPYYNIGRPFTKKTVQDLKASGEHVKALKDGLTKNGIRVK